MRADAKRATYSDASAWEKSSLAEDVEQKVCALA
jgi:hypothetical protein